MKPFRLLCLILIGLLSQRLTAAEQSWVTPVTMQLDWIYNVQFAGLYQAKSQGYYAAAGLDVTLVPAQKGQKTVEAVLSRTGLSLGCAESNVLLRARSEGAPIVALATMFQGSPMGWMYLPESGISSLADFQGKRIGVHPDGEKVIRLLFERQGLQGEDIELPNVGYDPAILISGEVDAMQAYYIDEFVKLQLETNGQGAMIMAKDAGYSAYSQVFFTTESLLAENEAALYRFLKASQLGWQYALENIEETVDLVLQEYNPQLDRAYQVASLEKIRELVMPDGQQIMAPMDRKVWEQAQADYLQFGLLEAPADLDQLLDFRLNP